MASRPINSFASFHGPCFYLGFWIVSFFFAPFFLFPIFVFWSPLLLRLLLCRPIVFPPRPSHILGSRVGHFPQILFESYPHFPRVSPSRLSTDHRSLLNISLPSVANPSPPIHSAIGIVFYCCHFIFSPFSVLPPRFLALFLFLSFLLGAFSLLVFFRSVALFPG